MTRNGAVAADERCRVMTFLEYTKQRWGENWAVGPALKPKRTRYDRIVTHGEYDQAWCDFRKDYPREWIEETYEVSEMRDLALELYDALLEADPARANRIMRK